MLPRGEYVTVLSRYCCESFLAIEGNDNMSEPTELDIRPYIAVILASRALYYSFLTPLLLFVLYVIGSEIERYLARVSGLPGPRGLPLVGSLPWLWGQVHAEKYRQWAAEYGDVFQVQLGNRTAVVVNSSSAARSLFLGQREATNSRPLFYVLHQKVQSGGSVTSIGTSPWDDSCNKRRKVAATALNKAAVHSYFPVWPPESPLWSSSDNSYLIVSWQDYKPRVEGLRRRHPSSIAGEQDQHRRLPRCGSQVRYEPSADAELWNEVGYCLRDRR